MNVEKLVKSKRSSMIRSINDNGRLKIERIRKEDDKRFFKYCIMSLVQKMASFQAQAFHLNWSDPYLPCLSKRPTMVHGAQRWC